MKRLFAILILALSVSVANAWVKSGDEAVVVLASKHLNANTSKLLTHYLGDSFADDVQYLNSLERSGNATFSKEIHFLHLKTDYTPSAVEGDDAFKEIERAAAVVKSRHSHSKDEVVKALRTIINLMCDIHNFSNVRIESIPHSQQAFKFKWTGGDAGKYKRYTTVAWSRFWNAYGDFHVGMSGNFWAEDLEYGLGKYAKEYAEGDLTAWVAQIGAKAAELYNSWAKPDYEMSRRQRNELEELNSEMMARAGYRLAKLLNTILIN